MSVLHRRRRDLTLVAVTALASFAVAVPLTSGSSGTGKRQFTIWPGNSARFANMDWNCDHFAGNQTTTGKTALSCARESTFRGIRMSLTGDALKVFRCLSASSCQLLLNARRSP